MALFDCAEFVQRPQPEDELADNLFLRNTAYLAASGIAGYAAMVAHDEIPSVRHLIGQFDIAFARCLFFQIRLVKRFAIDAYITVRVDIHPFAGKPTTRLTRILLL